MILFSICTVFVIVVSFALAFYRPYVPDTRNGRGNYPGLRRSDEGDADVGLPPSGVVIRGPLNRRHRAELL